MFTMKERSVVASLLCISLFAATALARPFVDSSKQHYVASSGAQVKPDFFGSQPPPRLPGPWWWFGPPHRPGAHPPFHIPKNSHHQSTSVSDAKQQKDSASSSGFISGPGGRLLPWWWLIQPHPPAHSPAPAGLEATRDNDIEAAAAAAAAAAAIEKCWSPLAAVGNCVYDILSAFTTGTVEFDSACCSAINMMSNECVASFNDQEFSDTLSSYCSTH